MHKIFWDFEIQTDPPILARRLDIDLIKKKKEKKRKKGTELIFLWILPFQQTTD